MSSIRSVSSTTAQSLCAAQVVVSLSAVVKELVENALDAGCGQIDVQLLEAAGRSMSITVTDDGHGIDFRDRGTVDNFVRHRSSSKRGGFDDLLLASAANAPDDAATATPAYASPLGGTAETLGFRGEALHAIAQVGHLSVSSKVRGMDDALKVSFFSNSSSAAADAPVPDRSAFSDARASGTKAVVENLFHSLPVRRADFERSKKRHITDAVQALRILCLSRPAVRLHCSHQASENSKIVTLLSVTGNAAVARAARNSGGGGGSGSRGRGSAAVATAVSADMMMGTPADLQRTLGECFTPRICTGLKHFSVAPKAAPEASENGECDDPLRNLHFSIEGFLSRPGTGRSTPDMQFTFLDGRHVRMGSLLTLINDCYAGAHASASAVYPVVVLHLRSASSAAAPFTTSASTPASASAVKKPHPRGKGGDESDDAAGADEHDDDNPFGSMQLQPAKRSSSAAAAAVPRYDINLTPKKDKVLLGDEASLMIAVRTALQRWLKEQLSETATGTTTGAVRPTTAAEALSSASKKQQQQQQSQSQQTPKSAANPFGSSAALSASSSASQLEKGAVVQGGEEDDDGDLLFGKSAGSSSSSLRSRSNATPATGSKPSSQTDFAAFLAGAGLGGGSFKAASASVVVPQSSSSSDDDGDAANDDSSSSSSSSSSQEDDDAVFARPSRPAEPSAAVPPSSQQSKPVITPLRALVDEAEQIQRQRQLDQAAEAGSRADLGQVESAFPAAAAAAAAAAQSQSQTPTQVASAKYITSSANAGGNRVLLRANSPFFDARLVERWSAVAPPDSDGKSAKKKPARKSAAAAKRTSSAKRRRQRKGSDDEDEDEESSSSSGSDADEKPDVEQQQPQPAVCGNDAAWSKRGFAEAEQTLGTLLSKEMFRRLRVIGQFNNGFILTVSDEGHVFIHDQHASDEKANYERHIANMTSGTGAKCQPLLKPQVVVLDPDTVSAAVAHSGTLAGLGFRVKAVDDDACSLAVSSVPVLPYDRVAPADVADLCAQLKDYGAIVKPLKAMWHSAATLACRRSIMIGTALDVPTMVRVIRNLETLHHPWNCPHGRPTVRHVAHVPGAAAATGAAETQTQEQQQQQQAHLPALPSAMASLPFPAKLKELF